ncbi:hypothetical protein SELMODRAFT_141243 [Selaginella moellendorffii]|uniref:AMP-dependent synthetase/ligase domain-containing protein n=1 Tax=Selaginella moellendorffii TaxID=88036 RepID=D8QV47_SELML|nr:long chain acyl-CoA synthetase 9, chloroplastic [Selaginella moellendorffii]XP_024545850.1 long chain acyl-CoA synthetase 9, chloroplastic [Selaginella moellendorffii]XP_024545856.1 long chain acyl-CoA synthetase 9, chloroplastic [Selaginella moellendorffii]EFJ36404.1 hypothetical protein SELMODRAFT_141243 [Selaginella moellendorffii]|eukprot:XP_024545842.1 long chain acyl-CoA synthetase 9, chloroplastic [Selaginella moellendorffii]
MPGFLASLLLPVLMTMAMRFRKKSRLRGVAEEVGGEPGVTRRNQRFPALVETPWEGATTLAALFEQACEKYADQPLLGTRTLISVESEAGPDGRSLEKVTLGPYVWISYGQAFEKVKLFSSGLLEFGHVKEEKIALFAETRAEWLIALQACFRNNITVVTIYASLGEDALAHSLNETEVTTVICDRKQLKKLIDLGESLETVRRVVYMDDDSDKSTLAACAWQLESFSNIEKLGKGSTAQAHFPNASDIAVIMYTSGSTGLPKGVIMSHRNIVATIAGVMTVVADISPKDVYIAYLPLAHILELTAETTMCAAGVAIGYGSPLTLTDTSSKIKKGTKGDVGELKPTLMTAVPAILDRVRDGVRRTVEAKGGLAKRLFQTAYRRRLGAVEGSWLGAWGLERVLWNAVVFKNVKRVLGGRLRGMLSGGAPLSGDTQRFINICLGVPIAQGYGLTETCAGATFSEWDDTSVGRVGPPVPHCYVKLVDWEAGGYLASDKPLPRGEIVIGGPSVTIGYFKNQAKTDEVYKTDENGLRWFYTGDIGQFHPDGCLEIVDRKKDIVKLQHGEYISLGKIEAALVVSPYVDSIMAHADPFHNFCVALIVPSQTALENWAKRVGQEYNDYADLCQKEESIKEILKSISQTAKQARLQKSEIPSKIKLLPDPWTPETGLVTAALKIKRENIRKAFAEDLKKLYQ